MQLYTYYTVVVLCAKRVEMDFCTLWALSRSYCMLLHINKIPIFTDHDDITSHDSHVRTMAEMADTVVRIG